MTTEPLGRAVRQLREAMLPPDEDGLSDGQLLGRYLERGDAAAFEALLRRHGPMVLAVCRRVLRHSHDAEDAFQAAFLVLVKKAGSVRPREMLANWLHGVAYNTALKARASGQRRRRRETQADPLPERESARQDEEHRDEQRALLDGELSRLPDKYRAPVVLCDLQGQTRKEAARRLGWPEGTLSSRLAKARATLARRLARHGPTASADPLAGQAAPECLPPSLAASTAEAAAGCAAGRAVASASVAALTERVVRAMWLTKLIKVTAAALLALLAAGAGALAVSQVGLGRAPAERADTKDVQRPALAAAAERGGPKPEAEAPNPEPPRDLAWIARQMLASKDSLEAASCGEQTQKMQKEIVARFDEMIKELEERQKNGGGQAERLAELKIIRSTQKRVNDRTVVYGRVSQNGRIPRPEDAKDDEQRDLFGAARRDLKDLADRQGKLVRTARDLAARK
jgi:RNA polymerase sigma factor (sigma-70 family)